MQKKEIYNKGVESGLRVAQQLIEKEAKAMEYLNLKIDQIVDGHDQMKTAVNLLIEDANENAIARIFNISNTVRPCDLKEHEKVLLLNIIATLSQAGQNEQQRKFANNLRQHLHTSFISPLAGYAFSNIESLESVRAIKVIAKAVRVYLFLETNSFDSVFRHEDDLFSHFEIRSFDEIDAQIDLIFFLFGEDGLTEIYGDFSEKEESIETKYPFYGVEEKESIEISNECAQIYFSDCHVCDAKRHYIESTSYIIYNKGNDILCLHKQTGLQNILLSGVDDTESFLQKNKITTFADYCFYALDHDLYYVDLNIREPHYLFSIDTVPNNNNGVYEIEDIRIYNGQKLIYRNGNLYITDLNQEEQSPQTVSLVWGSASGKYFLNGDYLYFAEEALDFNNTNYMQYSLKRYGILNNHEITVSKPFGRHKDSGILEVAFDGMFENTYYCIMKSFSSEYNLIGMECAFIQLDSTNTAQAHPFYIWQTGIYQIEQYKNYLVYVNADKDYSLVSHNYLNDKKTVLRKKYGYTQKRSLLERLALDKEDYQHPEGYMRLGKWIWVSKGSLSFEIIPIM